MIIQIALLDDDVQYVQHFCSAVSSQYSDRLEISSFSNYAYLCGQLDSRAFDIILVSEQLYTEDLIQELQQKNILDSALILTKNSGVISIKEKRAVSRYQKMEKIYRQILDAYAEIRQDMRASIDGNQGREIISFISASGGTGKTSVMMAYATHLAQKGKKVLVMSLERYSSIEIFFQGNEDLTLSNVLYAIKKGKGNVVMKVESTISTDSGGISYIHGVQNPYELSEMEENEWKELLRAILAMGQFDCIMIEAEDIMASYMNVLLEYSTNILLVGMDRDSSNHKTRCYLDMLTKKEQNATQYLGKMTYVVNRASQKKGQFDAVFGVKKAYIPDYNIHQQSSLLGRMETDFAQYQLVENR